MAQHNIHHNIHRGKAYFFYLFLCLVFAFMGIAMPHTASAYQFFQIESGGTFLPVKWRTLPVNFVVDNGPTDILPEIQTAVDTWNNVATAQNVLGTPTRAAVDFTGANFGTAWGNLTADGQQEVIFDEDGSSFAAVGLDPASVNGYGPSRREVVGGQGAITDAYLLLNGTRADFDRQSTEVHELGHIQGLAHCSVGMFNSASAPSDALDPINIASVPTMHPFSSGTGSNRRTVEQDDIAGFSELYPEASFSTTFGGIEGTVTRCFTDPPEPVLGVNVRAVNTANANIQVTRYSGYDGNTTGRFVISGLPPGSYRLLIEAMGANGFTSGRMAIVTRVDAEFPTEYYNPPEEDDCTEEIPDTAVNVDVSASLTTINKDFKVGGVSLAFVVDDTGSMGNEIDGVRSVLSNFVSIIDELNSTLGIPFPDTAIITFKDNVTNRLISNDPDRLQAVINSLFASGGGDCPESSNAALLTAGRLLKKDGVAMLFTDADSRPDGPSREAVEGLFRSKSLTLSTLLSGSCTEETFSAAVDLSKEKRYMGPSGSENALDEYPPEPTLGIEGAIRTFSEISVETGGFFTFNSGIKFGDPEETQRYINTGTNIAVSSVVPAIGLVTPGDGPQGSTLNVEITGANTNFQSSSVVSFSGTGITVNSLTVNSPTSITANISVSSESTLGFRDVTVTTQLGGDTTETAIGTGSFQVVTPPFNPTIIGVTPPQGAQGESLDVSIAGANTNFVDGESLADFGSGITVNSTRVLNSTSAVANITIDEAASVGFRDVIVTTDAKIAFETVVGPFLVTAPPPLIPRITSVDPSESLRGKTLNVTIVGENTSFVNGVSVASFSGTGITVNTTTVTSPTSATANITIADDAPVGFRDVFVTTGDEVAAILGAFNVTAEAPPITLGVSLKASPKKIKVGKTIKVEMKVKNIGTQSATVTPSVLTVTGDGSVQLLAGPKPPSATIKKPKQSKTFIWKYRATGAGSVRFIGFATSPQGNSLPATSKDVKIRESRKSP